VLEDTARERPCPDEDPFTYPFDNGTDVPAGTFTATCEGDREFNGFYGFGIVNALAAAKAADEEEHDD
jgi:hypothetical protein